MIITIVNHQVLICVMLFMVAMILKHVLEKLIGYTCHEETYFKRMRKALRHEFYIMALSEPPKSLALSQRVMAHISMPSLHIHVRLVSALLLLLTDMLC